MKTHLATITGLEQINNEVCVQIKTQPFLQPIAGQFFQAFTNDSEDLLPTLLYPCGITSSGLLLCGDIPKSWSPGTELHLRGPRGNGFHLPPLARRVALTLLDQHNPNRLTALTDIALANGSAVTLFTDQHFADLAPEIEVLPLEELSQARQWADYLAAVLLPSQINGFRDGFMMNVDRHMSCVVEVMLQTPMPCDEHSLCGLCSILTRSGCRLACKDGPVFYLDDLLGEEGYPG